MARTGGYIVLERNGSSSSDKVYELRRGGDGVLYCTPCPGWAHNKPAAGHPKTCKHTKDYVARHPGTLYGPPGAFVSENPPGGNKAVVQRVKRREVASAPAANLKPAAANWREMILTEREGAQKRGIATPAAEAAEFERSICLLDLDGPGEVRPSADIVAASRLDLGDE